MIIQPVELEATGREKQLINQPDSNWQEVKAVLSGHKKPVDVDLIMLDLPPLCMCIMKVYILNNQFSQQSASSRKIHML